MEMINLFSVVVFCMAVLCAFVVFVIALMGIGVVWASKAIVLLLNWRRKSQWTKKTIASTTM